MNCFRLKAVGFECFSFEEPLLSDSWSQSDIEVRLKKQTLHHTLKVRGPLAFLLLDSRMGFTERAMAWILEGAFEVAAKYNMDPTESSPDPGVSGQKLLRCFGFIEVLVQASGLRNSCCSDWVVRAFFLVGRLGDFMRRCCSEPLVIRSFSWVEGVWVGVVLDSTIQTPSPLLQRPRQWPLSWVVGMDSCSACCSDSSSSILASELLTRRASF